MVMRRRGDLWGYLHTGQALWTGFGEGDNGCDWRGRHEGMETGRRGLLPSPTAGGYPPLSGWVAGWVEGRPLSGFQTPLKEDAPPSPMRNGVVLPWRTYPHRRRCPHR